MRGLKVLRFLSATAAAMPLVLSAGLAAPAARSIPQACSGVLTLEDGYYQLKPDAGATAWCDSNVSQELIPLVLKACKVGSRCRIVGSVQGHGVFYWMHISSVTRLK